jgi:hypothetical protein
VLAAVKIELKKARHLYIEKCSGFIIIFYFEFLIPHNGERMSVKKKKKHQQDSIGKTVVIRGVTKMK